MISDDLCTRKETLILRVQKLSLITRVLGKALVRGYLEVRENIAWLARLRANDVQDFFYISVRPLGRLAARAHILQLGMGTINAGIIIAL